MIAEVANVTIAGIDFCHATSRRALHSGANTIMTQSWTGRRHRYPRLETSASAGDCL